MPRRRVAFADLSNSAERAATRKKPVARTQAAPSPSIPLPSPSSAASKEYPPWTRCFDPRYKYHYWYNHTTGESQWTEPDEAWVDEQLPVGNTVIISPSLGEGATVIPSSVDPPYTFQGPVQRGGFWEPLWRVWLYSRRSFALRLQA